MFLYTQGVASTFDYKIIYPSVLTYLIFVWIIYTQCQKNILKPILSFSEAKFEHASVKVGKQNVNLQQMFLKLWSKFQT